MLPPLSSSLKPAPHTMQRADNDREANAIARLASGMAARAMSGRLDRALANGAEPSANRLLAKRAAQLTSRSTRSNVAGVLVLDLTTPRCRCPSRNTS